MFKTLPILNKNDLSYLNCVHLPEILSFCIDMRVVDLTQFSSINKLVNLFDVSCLTIYNLQTLMQTVITRDESWVYGYEIETKARSKIDDRQWQSDYHCFFFDFNGVVHFE